MPKIVCVKCEVEYKPEENGITLEEMANFGSYKLWNADLFKCPKCGNEIVGGFADRPFAEHFEDNYKEVLAKEGKTYKDYEK
ncbi:hypothetical protein LCGC14_0972420 [marine sediment metagenome]|uniref:Uncharacterized protein n=1 Tax=marine sediment metagenome TaxID=412755 RepID=A0A0F9NBB8_9ZZZZ